MLKRIKSKKGFTLIELIVVIAILGILAAILVPTMLGIVNDSKTQVNTSNARSIYSIAQTTFVSMNTDQSFTFPDAATTYDSTKDTNAYLTKVIASLDNELAKEGFKITVSKNGVSKVEYKGAFYPTNTATTTTTTA